jgi:hypothetical protein
MSVPLNYPHKFGHEIPLPYLLVQLDGLFWLLVAGLWMTTRVSADLHSLAKCPGFPQRKHGGRWFVVGGANCLRIWNWVGAALACSELEMGLADFRKNVLLRARALSVFFSFRNDLLSFRARFIRFSSSESLANGSVV